MTLDMSKNKPELPMRTLDDLFRVETAKSHSAKVYSDGSVPFITSAELNNGITQYVQPLDGDKTFEGPCIVISGLGFATVHEGTILPKGNGGDACAVLYSKSDFGLNEYLCMAAAFNVLHSWRFSFGRKTSLNRLKALLLPAKPPATVGLWRQERSNLTEIVDAVEASLSSATTTD